MSDNMTELVRRAKEGLNYDSGLRDRVGWDETIGNLVKDYERLAGENERLRAALQPLANLAGNPKVLMIDPLDKWFTISQLHDAYAALNPHNQEKP